MSWVIPSKTAYSDVCNCITSSEDYSINLSCEFILFLCRQLSDTSQQSENLKARVSRELSRIEDLNKNTQSSKDNVTGQ